MLPDRHAHLDYVSVYCDERVIGNVPGKACFSQFEDTSVFVLLPFAFRRVLGG